MLRYLLLIPLFSFSLYLPAQVENAPADPARQQAVDSLSQMLDQLNATYEYLKTENDSIAIRREQRWKMVMDALDTLKAQVDRVFANMNLPVYAVTWPQDSIHLGELKKGRTVKFRIEVVCAGSGYISIYGVKTSCDCIESKRYHGFVMDSAETGWADLKYKIPRNVSGLQQEWVTIELNEKELSKTIPVTVYIRGRGRTNNTRSE